MHQELQSLVIGVDASVREALGALDAGGHEICLVTAGERLVGVLSDGDIRRAILGGLGLDDLVLPAVNHDFVTVGPGEGRAEVLDLMEAGHVAQVPVVGTSGEVLGLHVLQDLIGPQRRPNVAVIMAGGQGVRLRPLTETMPKPMLPVAGRPILERLVLHLTGHGVRRIVLAVNYLAEVIIDHFGDGSRLGCDLSYVREDPQRPLGTAGALSRVRKEIGTPEDPLLVMNGDLVTSVRIDGMLNHHAELDADLTVGVDVYTHAVPFGVVDVVGDEVRNVTEKPVATWKVNAGIYVLSPSLLELVPDEQAIGMTDVVLRAVKEGRRVSAFPVGDDWIDVGVPAELARARGHSQ